MSEYNVKDAFCGYYANKHNLKASIEKVGGVYRLTRYGYPKDGNPVVEIHEVKSSRDAYYIIAGLYQNTAPLHSVSEREYRRTFIRDIDAEIEEDELLLEEIAQQLAVISKRQGRCIDIDTTNFVSADGERLTTATVTAFNRFAGQETVHRVARVVYSWDTDAVEGTEGMLSEAAAHDVKGE